MTTLTILILEMVAGFFFMKLVLLFLFTAFNLPLVEEIKEITADWVQFMKRGIPIPSDHLKREHVLRGEPTFIPIQFQYKKQDRLVR